jgi:hypothetical protein
MKSIEEQIGDAREDLEFIEGNYAGPHWQPTQARMAAKARKRLADLEAVRDGRAEFVYATVSMTADGGWLARGVNGVDPTARADARFEDVLNAIEHETGDRLTILRGVAYLPPVTTDEADAESEEA